MICNFQFASPIIDGIFFENFKQNILLFNDNYVPGSTSKIPIEGKESSVNEIVYNAEVCHQQIVDNGINRLILIGAEHSSDVKYRQIFKSTYPHLPAEQAFLLSHCLNLTYVKGYVDFDGSTKSLNLVSAYTHSYNPSHKIPNLLLSGRDFRGDAY